MKEKNIEILIKNQERFFYTYAVNDFFPIDTFIHFNYKLIITKVFEGLDICVVDINKFKLERAFTEFRPRPHLSFTVDEDIDIDQQIDKWRTQVINHIEKIKEKGTFKILIPFYIFNIFSRYGSMHSVATYADIYNEQEFLASINELGNKSLPEEYWKKDAELHNQIMKESEAQHKRIEMSHDTLVRKFDL